MRSLKENIVANLIGRIWSASLTLLLIPVYIRMLGIEAYGLIGFYTTLLASLMILDLGLSTTLNRELARARATGRDAQEVRNLVFSLESIYMLVGLVVGGIVVLLAPFLATHWIKADQIPPNTVIRSLMLMGVVIAFQWSVSLYNGGLLGLEKQVLYNVIMVVMTTIRAAGVLVLFFWVEPSILVFFVWQAVISLIYVLWMRIGLWANLPKSPERASFSVQQLKTIWKFATGMTGVGITAFLLAQIDKVVLSKLLPMSQFGYYTLALTLTSALGTLITPIYTAVFPRFTAMISVKDIEALKKNYHTVCKLVATIVFPVGLFIAFFAADILQVWTGNLTTVAESTRLVQVLSVAAIFSCLICVPIILVQAFGSVRFIFLQNLVGCFILVPLLFVLTDLYGALGGALVLLLLNTGYIFISLPLIHQRLLKGETIRWYLDDMLLPMLTPLVFLGAVKLISHYYFPSISLNLWWLGSIGATGFLFSMLCNVQMRQTLLHLLSLKEKTGSINSSDKRVDLISQK